MYQAGSVQHCTSQQQLEEIYRFAAEQLRDGARPDEVEKSLLEQGVDLETARVAVNELTRLHAQANKAAGLKNMIYGAMWCIGGIAVTVFSHQAAAGAGGGRYVVAWGAVVFGAIQFFRGVFQTAARS
jgi:hypothetical protein